MAALQSCGFLIFVTLLSSSRLCMTVWGLNFDSIIFTQQWPETSCIERSFEHESCSIPGKVSTWTVHGLWPTKTGTHGPENCNSSMKFDINALKPIKDMLLQYWPNLFPDTKMDDFWKHEWDKHGTCAAELAVTDTEFKYFSMGLKANKAIDLYSMLLKKGITPSSTKTYSLEDFSAAINSALGKKVFIECYQHKGDQYIFQVEVCMDTTYAPIDCAKSGGCSYKKPVIYAPIKHQ